MALRDLSNSLTAAAAGRQYCLFGAVSLAEAGDRHTRPFWFTLGRPRAFGAGRHGRPKPLMNCMDIHETIQWCLAAIHHESIPAEQRTQYRLRLQQLNQTAMQCQFSREAFMAVNDAVEQIHSKLKRISQWPTRPVAVPTTPSQPVLHFEHPQQGLVRMAYMNPLPVSMSEYRCELCGGKDPQAGWQQVDSEGDAEQHCLVFCVGCGLQYLQRSLRRIEGMVNYQSPMAVLKRSEYHSSSFIRSCRTSLAWTGPTLKLVINCEVSASGEDVVAFLLPSSVGFVGPECWAVEKCHLSSEPQPRNGEECSICCDDIYGTEIRPVIQTACGHFFHRQCLGKTWYHCLHRKQPFRCPVCRAEDPLHPKPGSSLPPLPPRKVTLEVTAASGPSGPQLLLSGCKYTALVMLVADRNFPADSWGICAKFPVELQESMAEICY